MTEKIKFSMEGQWFGYFRYGHSYGELEGERVIFSLLIEEGADDTFTGKCIELEGIGANTEVSFIEGSVNDGYITFIKKYETNYSIDEHGTEVKLDDDIMPLLTYAGRYEDEKISGLWQVSLNQEEEGNEVIIHTSTGTWEISKDPEAYGI